MMAKLKMGENLRISDLRCNEHGPGFKKPGKYDDASQLKVSDLQQPNKGNSKQWYNGAQKKK